jgi:hypothetical protein
VKLTQIELSIVRGPLAAFGVTLFLALAVAIATHQYHLGLQAERDGTRRELSAARLQLTNAKSQETQFNENAELYRQLSARGLFEEERRLEWIDHVGRMRERHRIFNVDYDLSAQQPIASQTADVAALATKIELKIDALHEQDLVDFLDELKQLAPGIVLLDSCAMSKLDPLVSERLSPHITAICTMRWITVSR